MTFLLQGPARQQNYAGEHDKGAIIPSAQDHLKVILSSPKLKEIVNY
jgi:hypothetical protein